MSKLTLTLSVSGNETRGQRIRKARSVNDLLDVLKDIAKDVGVESKTVSGLVASLAAGDEEIRIVHTGLEPAPVLKTILRNSPATDSLGTKLTKFVAPPAKVLASHQKVIQSMYENAKDLDSIEAMLAQAFPDALKQPQALKAVTALKAEVDKSIYQSLTALGQLAVKHLPAEMKKLGDKMVGFVLDTVPATSYENLTQMVYVAPVNENLEFSLYVGLENLQDNAGFRYGDFYFVLTGVVKDSTIKYYVNNLHEFKAPGSYDIGEEVDNEKAIVRRIQNLISTDDLLSDEERRPLPITTKHLQNKNVHTLPNVAGVEVKDDTIWVYLKPRATENEILELTSTLIPLLKSVIGLTQKSQSVLKNKVVTRMDGKTKRQALEFILTPSIPKGEKAKLSLNLRRLADLEDVLNLNPGELEKVKLSLKKLL